MGLNIDLFMRDWLISPYKHGTTTIMEIIMA